MMSIQRVRFQWLRELGRPFRVLAIETSCDDSAVSILDSSGKILAENVSSQYEIHSQYQGIVPRVAQQSHRARLPRLVKETLDSAGVRLNDIDLFTATKGPGMAGSLTVGIDTCRTLAAVADKPFIPMNHMEGHALIPRLKHPQVAFPYLCLLISGGHTLLVIVRGPGDYTQLGTTTDDSLGEAIDKASRTLTLPWYGKSPAAALTAIAYHGNPKNFPLPRLRSSRIRQSCDFSFAGLKTAFEDTAAKALSGCPDDSSVKADLAASFVQACADHVADRLVKAFELTKDLFGRRLPLAAGGGAARNHLLIASIEERIGASIFRPEERHCTDNATMIAWAALEYESSLKLECLLSQDIDPKQDWPLQDLKIETN